MHRFLIKAFLQCFFFAKRRHLHFLNSNLKNFSNFCIFQVISALAVSFGPFAVGLGKGYTSPALASLLPNQNEDSNDDSTNQIPPFAPHLPNIQITEQQGSWIASLSLLGALFGGLCSGLIIKHGRRKTLILVSIPFSVSWAFTLFAYCVEMIYATAFIAGFCSAIIQVSDVQRPIFILFYEIQFRSMYLLLTILIISKYFFV